MSWWWILGGVCTFLVLAAVAFVVYAVMRDNKRKEYSLEHGEETHGWLVQANAALFEKGDMDLPALVVISPDEETNDDEEFMLELAADIMALKDEKGKVIGSTKAERFVSKLMSDERYIEGKQDKLPSEFTEGREVYLVHIYIYREHLPRKKLTEPKIPCVIVWGDESEMVCTRPVRKSKRSWDDDD